MKYQVILFDADGVLIKSQYQFSDRLESEYGISHEKLLPFFKGVFRECSLGRADLKEELTKVIFDWGWKGTVDELLHFWFTKGTEIDEEMAEFVRELRRSGVRTYMTTDQERYRGEHLRKTLGGGNLFDEVFFSAEIGAPKKEQTFFEHVYRKIGNVPRENVLFIDDDEKNVESAKQFGFNAVLFTNLNALRKQI